MRPFLCSDQKQSCAMTHGKLRCLWCRRHRSNATMPLLLCFALMLGKISFNIVALLEGTGHTSAKYRIQLCSKYPHIFPIPTRIRLKLWLECLTEIHINRQFCSHCWGKIFGSHLFFWTRSEFPIMFRMKNFIEICKYSELNWILNSLKRLPKNIAQFEPPALFCGVIYLQCVSQNGEMTCVSQNGEMTVFHQNVERSVLHWIEST